MDMFTLAMAKAYTDSKGGYTDGYSIAFDGNPEGKTEVSVGAGYFYKVSSKVLTKEELIGATYVDTYGTAVVTEEHIITVSAIDTSTKFYGLMVRDAEAPFVVSCKACSFDFNGATVVVPEDGTYFAYLPTAVAIYVSELSKETIHPIDPKYLPGVCLPVVELSTTVSHGAWFTAEENAKLKAAYEGNTPIAIKCNITVDTDSFENTCAVWARIGGAGPVFTYSYGAAVLAIASRDGGDSWLCIINS